MSIVIKLNMQLSIALWVIYRFGHMVVLILRSFVWNTQKKCVGLVHFHSHAFFKKMWSRASSVPRLQAVFNLLKKRKKKNKKQTRTKNISFGWKASTLLKRKEDYALMHKEDNNSDGKSGAAQAKDKKHKGHSQRHGNFLSHSFFSLLCLCNVVYLVNYFLLPCLWWSKILKYKLEFCKILNCCGPTGLA